MYTGPWLPTGLTLRLGDAVQIEGQLCNQQLVVLSLTAFSLQNALSSVLHLLRGDNQIVFLSRTLAISSSPTGQVTPTACASP